MPEALRPLVCSSVILVGGCARIPGLAARVESELRAALPQDFPLTVECPENPHCSAWRGSGQFATEIHYSNFRVPRQDFQEYGAGLCASKFALF